eukprot:scaffold92265_cov32-Tisochrysis_lutea.AAC.4
MARNTSGSMSWMKISPFASLVPLVSAARAQREPPARMMRWAEKRTPLTEICASVNEPWRQSSMSAAGICSPPLRWTHPSSTSVALASALALLMRLARCSSIGRDHAGALGRLSPLIFSLPLSPLPALLCPLSSPLSSLSGLRSALLSARYPVLSLSLLLRSLSSPFFGPSLSLLSLLFLLSQLSLHSLSSRE